MVFKVKIDLSDANNVLSMLGLGAIAKKPYWIKVDAKDPDDACSKAREKVSNTIKNTFEALEVSSSRAKYAIKEAAEKMKIIKIKIEK